MAHCMPLADRPRSCWIVGAAIETMVWSMKVIATAKIIAVRIRLFDLAPVPVAAVALIVILLDQDEGAYAQASIHGTDNLALGSHERVGENVDARQVGGQVRGEVMAGS